MENSKETSFERMKQAVRELVKEDLEVEVTSCKSHTGCTLKVVAFPEAVDTVEVFVPYQIFVGAKTNDVCAEWELSYWKMALRQLCFEFGAKDCPRTRLMTRRVSGVSPRMYANYFWKRIESMNGWNIVLPSIPKTQVIKVGKQNATAQLTEGEECEAIHKKADIVNSFELMGLKFACM